LANPLSASATAAAGLPGLVTPVTAIKAMATMDCAERHRFADDADNGANK
jgi:hypothetical protein